MKAKYGQLAGVIFLIYIVLIESRDAVRTGDWGFVLDWFSYYGGLLMLSSLLTTYLYAANFYTILKRFHPKYPIWVLIPIGFIGSIVVIGFRYFIEEVFYEHLFGFDNYNDKITWGYYILDNSFNAIIFSAVGIVFFFIQYSKYEALQRQALLLQNKKTELAFLRSQINPHFLFNTLNNIYTLVYQKSDRALEAMNKLTALLRYALYEPNEQVPFRKEFNYIEDFIALQRLRYDYEVYIEIEGVKEVASCLVPPFLYLPFVENAFKHGDLRHPTTPFQLHFSKDDTYLILNTQNQVRIQAKDMSGGIGLENIQKRLSLLYPDQHDLTITQTNNQFLATLKIPLAI